MATPNEIAANLVDTIINEVWEYCPASGTIRAEIYRAVAAELQDVAESLTGSDRY